MNSHANATNIYRRLRRLASLCADASRIETGGKARHQLAKILERSLQGEFESYTDLLLLTLTEERLGIDDNQIGAMVSALRSDNIDLSQVGVIEELGTILYQETAQALSRLRSG